MRPNAARHIDQVLGILRVLIALPKDAVIASQFPFFSQLRHSPPGKRVEPIHTHAELRNQLREPVAALNMNQFMSQHDLQPIGRPIAASTGRRITGVRNRMSRVP